MLTRALTAAAVAVLCSAGFAVPATAALPGDQPVDVNTNGSGEGAGVTVRAEDPGHVGNSTNGGAGTTTGTVRQADTRTCSYLGDPVDCTSSSGLWSQDRQCWVQRLSPQPPADDPIWKGHNGGAIYWCQDPIDPNDAVMSGAHMFWAPSAGAAGAPVLVDPVTLAEEAIDRMDLVGARVGATPLNGGDGIVGLQTWLWVANDGPTSMGPITRTASAGSVTVTATARVTQVEWDMGNGDEVRCSNAGTPWNRGRGNGNSPTCGYTYYQDSGDQPGGVYTIRPTTRWRVEWSGAGQSGVITFTLAGGELPMPIVELQTVRVG